MASRGLNPNVDSPPEDNTRRVDYTGPAAEAERAAIREDARDDAEALDEVTGLRSADARREVPRLRTDMANPRKARSLPAPSAVRPMLSSRMKKDLNRTKTQWLGSLPKTRYRAFRRTMTDRAALEDVNRSLNGVVGMKSELAPATRRRAEAIDRAIQDFEMTNEREHVVYATLRAPKDHPASREAVVRRLRASAADPTSKPLTFDSYIPATHSLGNVNDSPDIVMEIRTRSGAYLGTSDTTDDANHLIGRGRDLRPVGVHEVTYTRPDGQEGTRLVVQMDDVTQDGRTTAE